MEIYPAELGIDDDDGYVRWIRRSSDGVTETNSFLWGTSLYNLRMGYTVYQVTPASGDFVSPSAVTQPPTGDGS